MIQGNYIGTDATGQNSVPNQGEGVIIAGSPYNLIGGPAAGQGNVISGNGSYGIEISDLAYPLRSLLTGTGAFPSFLIGLNRVQGNLIGTGTDEVPPFRTTPEASTLKVRA